MSRFALWVIFFHDFPENDPFITGAFLDITLWREDGGIFISCETGNIKAIFTDEKYKITIEVNYNNTVVMVLLVIVMVDYSLPNVLKVVMMMMMVIVIGQKSSKP